MKKIRLALICGLVTAVFLSMARFDALCQDMRDNVFRLHIVADSDEASDQALKLKVRDALLEEYGPLFGACVDVEQASRIADGQLQAMRRTAIRVLRENGCDDAVSCQVGPCWFDTRDYDTFTLPAGTYRALNVVIGKGQGRNWWCVLFPAVCLSGDAQLEESLCNDSAYVAEHPGTYRMKFKTVEIYEQIKKKIIKK